MTESGGTAGVPRSWDDLADRARVARARAYAPYSRFLVGAALEADDGRVFAGCNVENASYPVGACAERVALGHAVVSGARAFSRLAIVTSGAEPAPPCGMCRQALAEFGRELQIMSMGGDGASVVWRLRHLLPANFSLERITAPTEPGP